MSLPPRRGCPEGTDEGAFARIPRTPVAMPPPNYSAGVSTSIPAATYTSGAFQLIATSLLA